MELKYRIDVEVDSVSKSLQNLSGVLMSVGEEMNRHSLIRRIGSSMVSPGLELVFHVSAGSRKVPWA